MEAVGTNKLQLMRTKYMIKVGTFSAIAFLIMYLEFPILASVPYLQFDFSDVIALIGGITLGPIAAVIIELLKNILHAIFKPQTAGVGELANFIVGVAYILPVLFIYRKWLNIKGLIIGMVVGSFSMVAFAAIMNYVLILPLYGIVTPSEKISTLLGGLILFNVLKAIIQSITGFIIFNGTKGIFKYLKN